MAIVPCGCEGASILVDSCFFEHTGLLAGSEDQPLKPVKAADRPDYAGGANALDVDGCGFYVPTNSQKLEAGSGVKVSGNGGSTPWNVSLDLAEQSDQIAKIVDGKLLVQRNAQTIASTSCDEQLVLTAGGLTAGAKHYSRIATAVDTQPNQNFAIGQGGFLNTGPHQSNIVSVAIENPSCARAMAVQWTVEAELPYVESTGLIVFSLLEHAYLSSTYTVPGYAPQRQAAQTNLTGKMSPLSYTASGVIPPEDTLNISARLLINWSGTADFTLPSVQPHAFNTVDLRIDVIGTTT